MEERQALILGALLHDIGKFEFRARKDYTPHGIYSDYFVGEHLQQFRCLEAVREQIRRQVAYHHYADLADPSLREGDHITASEREADSSRYTRRPLVSVLSRVDIGKGALPEGVFYYPPGPVDAENPFPESVAGVSVAGWEPDEDEIIRMHSRAWAGFLEDVREMPDISAESFIETLMAVLEKHTSRVASAAYRSRPDICLFDHVRSVAAIAGCMDAAGHDADRPFLVIQGDVSRIQAFIYKLASPHEGGTKQTAKRLRGRSFYIGLLTETVVSLYLKRLGLCRANLIFSGGGHFLVLAPNTEESRKACADLEAEVNRWLYRALKGDLGLVTATLEVGREEIKDFAGVLNRAGYAISCEKRRKFRSILDATFFRPSARYGRQMDVCPVCQSDFAKGTKCRACESHVELGRQVVASGWLVRIQGHDVDGPGVFDGFSDLGVFWSLLRDADEVYNLLNGLSPERVTQVAVYRLNDTGFLVQKLVKLAEERGLPVSFGFQFLGNYAPRDAEGPKEFGELAAIGSENYPLLGIVRMDVDSLGHVFGSGLGDRKSLSRVATLSREMNLFFLGHINHLAKAHDIYITYSGGDDLFAVGSWTRVLDFAGEVREAFRRFCCGNPNLSLSAGILLCKESFPIGRAAEQCGKLEAEAKGAFPEAKDAVCVFGKTVRWRRYFELMSFAEELMALCSTKLPSDRRIPRSLVHQLIEIDMQSHDNKGEISMPAFTRNLTRLRYLVARHGVTQKKIDENERQPKPDPKVKALARLAMDPELMKDIRIPASYVVYTTRQSE